MNPVDQKSRLKMNLQGLVQGVGFRPYVFRLATRLNLTGWVKNSPQGAQLEVEGSEEDLKAFRNSLPQNLPPGAYLKKCDILPALLLGDKAFVILESEQGGRKETWILPDLATCPECLKELFDPFNRRYRYPFLNCTHCGPRFSIIETLPYDRPHTTMKNFTLCPECQKEYLDPLNRRFHAQPTACPACGPSLSLWDNLGHVLSEKEEALQKAIRGIQEGKVVAVKGLGGFHLLCDAQNEWAVQRLRHRKERWEKPLAVMAPDIHWVEDNCELSPEEKSLLVSPQAPILLTRVLQAKVAPSVAPENPFLGIMLPYTPLHHLLLAGLQFPVVATSGNRSEEPICIEETEALQRLSGIADLFLVHNRPIARPLDDSVARLLLGRPQLLRRSRGYAPLPLESGFSGPPLLAVGAHLKNTVTLTGNEGMFLSQHIGDLDTKEALAHFQRVASDLPRLYEADPSRVVCDLHPDYASTRWAQMSGKRVHRVQHHVAHIFACAAENKVEPPFLGVAWDGTGLGEDGTLWGGEFFKVVENRVQRVGRFKPFPLLGGDKAAREPRRSALGVLYGTYGPEVFERDDLPLLDLFTDREKKLFKTMTQKGIHSPLTSSVGRLFDAVSSLCSLSQVSRFEGQAAMKLEFALSLPPDPSSYGLTIEEEGPFWSLDWRPMIKKLLKDLESGISVSILSARFHNALAQGILLAAKREGLDQVLLSGGCFQNKYLSEKTVEILKGSGFTPYWHQQVPPNDGSISLGQAAYVLWKGE